MSKSSHVTFWLNGLRVGDEAATRKLWEGYFRRLVGLARKKLEGQRAGPDEPEDIALSAFKSFCRGVNKGRFPKLNDRDDLWKVLVKLTARKAINAFRREHAAKRDAGEKNAHRPPNLEDLVGREPTPSFAYSVAEQCQRLLKALEDETLCGIALSKLDGYSNPEISAQTGLSLATVERKLALIRRIWRELDADA